VIHRDLKLDNILIN